MAGKYSQVGGTMRLRSIGTHLPNLTASRVTRQNPTFHVDCMRNFTVSTLSAVMLALLN
jgi:hypothetical protein